MGEARGTKDSLFRGGEVNRMLRMHKSKDRDILRRVGVGFFNEPPKIKKPTTRKKVLTKKCKKCGRDIKPSFTFCDECREGAANFNHKLPLSTATVGAISELVVCVDLAKKGYEVFRAISPSCSCDLIARKNNICRRI